jgi:hypothetical protein
MHARLRSMSSGSCFQVVQVVCPVDAPRHCRCDNSTNLRWFHSWHESVSHIVCQCQAKADLGMLLPTAVANSKGFGRQQ